MTTSTKSAKIAPAESSDKRRWLPLALAVMMIVVVGVWQGIWSDRWTDPGLDAQAFARRLAEVPRKIGDWEGEDLATSPAELKGAGAVGHVSRVYKNRVTGQHVSLFLVCGHMRDISVHTPDRCYPSAGFEQLGAAERFDIETPAGAVETFTTTFRQIVAAGIVQQRVFWTWGYDDRWQAPDNPRVAFGGVRAMYKMYLISSSPTISKQPAEESPCLAFAADAMPTLDKLLFPAALEQPAPAR